MTNPTTAVVPYYFQETEVRTIIDEQGNALFVAKDVALILGYANTNDAINRHCRGVVKHYPIVDALGRLQEARVILLPDVCRLIVGSQLPNAVEFERWVFDEVLPAILQTGSYAVPGHLADLDKVVAIQEECLALYRKYAAVLEEQVATLKEGKKKRSHRPMTEEEKEQIVSMVASGMSQRAVASEMRRSSATVSYLVSERLRSANANGAQMELFPTGALGGREA